MKRLTKLLSNVKACKDCNGTGRYKYGHNMGEPIYKSCEECDGQGHIVKGWKK